MLLETGVEPARPAVCRRVGRGGVRLVVVVVPLLALEPAAVGHAGSSCVLSWNAGE